MTKRILIIGGGASGLMAAIHAAGNGAKVTILEQNAKLGQKILASGNGKCNYTNIGDASSAYRGTDPAYAAKILEGYSREETRDFFRKLGLLSIQHDGRLYPYSEQSQTILRLLENEARRLGVKIKTGERIVSVSKDNDIFKASTDSWTYEGGALILCCGSPASEVTGSSEDGYAFALSFGHKKTDIMPSLTYLKSKDKALNGWGGVRAYGRIALYADKELVAKSEGQLQLINNGISGIPVFQVSRFCAAALKAGKKVTLQVDFLTEEGEAILRENAPDNINQAVLGLFPDKLGKVLADSVKSTEELISKAHDFKINITSTGSLKHAQVAAGGVLTSEVDPASCQSKLVNGLYLCGELLDIDGDCGGWNLQFAWSTGAIAGRNAAL